MCQPGLLHAVLPAIRPSRKYVRIDSWPLNMYRLKTSLTP